MSEQLGRGRVCVAVPVLCNLQTSFASPLESCVGRRGASVRNGQEGNGKPSLVHWKQGGNCAFLKKTEGLKCFKNRGETQRLVLEGHVSYFWESCFCSHEKNTQPPTGALPVREARLRFQSLALPSKKNWHHETEKLTTYSPPPK